MAKRQERFDATFFSQTYGSNGSPQKAAHTNAKLNEHKLFVSHNDVYFSKKDQKYKDTYIYGSYANAEAFSDQLRYAMGKNRKCCFFEQMETDTPVYECYDLDWDLSVFTERDVLKLFCDIRGSFKKGPKLYSKDMRITSASRITDIDKSKYNKRKHTKLDVNRVPVITSLPVDRSCIKTPQDGRTISCKGSLHIVIRSKYAFKNVSHLKAFAQVFKIYWSHQVGKNETLLNVVDWGIYTNNRQMRTVYSCKQMSDRPLLPLVSHDYSARAPIEEFLITNVHPEAHIIEDFTPPISRGYSGPTLSAMGIVDEDIAEIIRTVLEDAFEYRITDTYVSLRRKRPSNCPSCNRVHEREGAYISITPGGQYKYCCFRDTSKRTLIGRAQNYAKISNFSDHLRICGGPKEKPRAPRKRRPSKRAPRIAKVPQRTLDDLFVSSTSESDSHTESPGSDLPPEEPKHLALGAKAEQEVPKPTSPFPTKRTEKPKRRLPTISAFDDEEPQECPGPRIAPFLALV